MGKNYDRLKNAIGIDRSPFIVYDVETTGRMNGHGNVITQVGLAAYKWNAANRSYELQDHLFILAKVDAKILDELEARRQPTAANVTRMLQEEYLFHYGRAEQKEYETALKHREEYKKHLDDFDKGVYSGRFARDTLKARYEQWAAKVPALQTTAERFAEEKRTKGNQLLETPDCKDFIESNFQIKMKELQDTISLERELAIQGIVLSEYRQGTLGLTGSEMQMGINEFLKKYDSNETYFITNGTYYQNHYLMKAGMRIDKDSAHIIDYTMISDEDAKLDAEVRLDAFVKWYKDNVGKTIGVFDAFTKALCYAEIAAKTCRLNLTNRSFEQLCNDVKHEAFKNDNNYVMSLSSMANRNWTFIDSRISADYTFDSLEYVEFGNDRRYVDLDKMFEVNNNFEITLEGEKEPIKTWEELEAKIKALNAHISDKLLDRIHDKYVELEHKVEVSKAAQKPEPKVETKPVSNPEPVPAPKPVTKPEPKTEEPVVKPKRSRKSKVKPEVTPEEAVKAVTADTEERKEANLTADYKSALDKLNAARLQLMQKSMSQAEVIYEQIKNVNAYLEPEWNMLKEVHNKGILNFPFPGKVCGCPFVGDANSPTPIDPERYGGELQFKNDIALALQNGKIDDFKGLFDPATVEKAKKNLVKIALDQLNKELEYKTKQINDIPDDLKAIVFGNDLPQQGL